MFHLWFFQPLQTPKGAEFIFQTFEAAAAAAAAAANDQHILTLQNFNPQFFMVGLSFLRNNQKF